MAGQREYCRQRLWRPSRRERNYLTGIRVAIPLLVTAATTASTSSTQTSAFVHLAANPRSCRIIRDPRQVPLASSAPDDRDGGREGDGDGLTAQERILRAAGISPETPEEREARIKAREEKVEEAKSEKRTNVAVAILAFLGAVLNYSWSYSHPVTPVQLLVEMQKNSSPANVIGNNGMPTVVDFWAPWCENCRVSAPTLQSIEKEYDGRVNFVMVNADAGEAWPLFERFGVDAIPHLAMISAEGDVETALIGPIPRTVLRGDLDTLIDNAKTAAAGNNCAVEDSANSASGGSNEGVKNAPLTLATSGTRLGSDVDKIVLPFDVPSGQTAVKGDGTASKVNSSCDEPKKELPYVMYDAFRNKPEERRVKF